MREWALACFTNADRTDTHIYINSKHFWDSLHARYLINISHLIFQPPYKIDTAIHTNSQMKKLRPKEIRQLFNKETKQCLARHSSEVEHVQLSAYAYPLGQAASQMRTHIYWYRYSPNTHTQMHFHRQLGKQNPYLLLAVLPHPLLGSGCWTKTLPDDLAVPFHPLGTSPKTS